MNCKESIELISGHIDGILDEREERFLQEHLESCPACREELTALKKTVSLVRDLEEVELPPRFLARVHERLAEQKPRMVLWNVFSRPQAQVALAACVLVALCFFAFYEYSSSRGGSVKKGMRESALKPVAPEAPGEMADESVPEVEHVQKQIAVPASGPVLREERVEIAADAMAVDNEESVSVRRSAGRGVDSYAKKEAADVGRDRAVVAVPRAAHVPAAPAVEMEAASGPAPMAFGMSDMAADKAGEARADADEIVAAEPAVALEGVAETLSGSVNVTIASGDRAAVAEVVRVFMPVAREEKAAATIRGKLAVQAEAIESSDSFELQVEAADYAVLMAKLGEVGDVTVSATADELSGREQQAATLNAAARERAASGKITVRITVVPGSVKQGP